MGGRLNAQHNSLPATPLGISHVAREEYQFERPRKRKTVRAFVVVVAAVNLLC